MKDILFKQDDFIFSYRVAGILMHEGKILLQRPVDDDFAIPGGHVATFETTRETLAREFKEEIRADVEVGELIAVGEIFFPWGLRPCHQIGLYYLCSLKDPSQVPTDGVFPGHDDWGNERIDLNFHWLTPEEVSRNVVYPQELIPHILSGSKEVFHFVSKQLDNTPRIETERLILRRFTPEDIPALLEIHSDEEVNRFLPWFPVKTLEEAEAFYQQRYAPKYARPWGYDYAICLKEDNHPIGYVNIDMGEAHDLGYGLRKEFWGQGIVPEAAAAVVDCARRAGMLFVTATHDVNNPRSGAVMQKIGMKYRYTYEEQWMPKDITVHFRMYQMNFNEKDPWLYRGHWDKYEKHYIEENL